MKTLRSFLNTLLVVGLSGFSLPNFADDTELYVRSSTPVINSSTRANILLIMDNSLSMRCPVPLANSTQLNQCLNNSNYATPLATDPSSMPPIDVTSSCLSDLEKSRYQSGYLPTRMMLLKDALCKVLDNAQNINIGLERFTDNRALGGNTPIVHPVQNIAAPFVSQNNSIIYDVPISNGNDDAEESSEGLVALNDKVLELTTILGDGVLYLPTTKYLEVPISSTENDAREMLGSNGSPADGVMYTNNDLALGASNTNGEQIVGLRFPNLEIPAGATILASWVEFTGYNYDCNCDGVVNLKVKGFDSANTPAFTNTSKDISNRTSTTAAVEWSNIETWAHKQKYTTPDLSEIVDGIVKKTDWATGRAIGLSFIRNPAYSAAEPDNKRSKNRRFYSADEATATEKAPVLKLFYTTEAGYAAGSAAIAARTYVPPAETTPVTIIKQISNNDDDAYEFLTSGGKSCYVGGVVKDKSSDGYTLMSLGAGRPSSSDYGNQLLGFRFPDLDIPKNATITDTKLTFIYNSPIDSTASNTELKVDIFSQDDSNPSDFSLGQAFTTSCSGITSAKNNLCNRLSSTCTKTGGISWTIPKYNEASTDSLGRKVAIASNLQTLVQSVVSRSDWNQTDNALVFLLKPTTAGSRRIYDYSDLAARATKLDITYTPPAETTTTTGKPNTSQKVGLRFQNVRVPRGATVTTAYVTFTSGVRSSTPTSLEIKAIASGDTAPFQVQQNDISSRTTTSSITWNASSTDNPMTTWETGTTYRTPELKTIVQPVINQSTTDNAWCGGNSLGFVISSSSLSSLRNALSYDSNPSSAPTLHIEFSSSSVPQNACIQQTLSTGIINANDDGVQTTTRDNTANDNTVFLTGTTDDRTLNMASTKKTTGSLTKRIVGVRFQNIPLERGTVIKGAKLVFTGSEDTSGDEDTDHTEQALGAAASLTIQGESGVALPFETTSNDFGSRTKTTSVDWAIPQTQKWATNINYETPDLKNIVQAIVNNGSWAVNGSMAFFITSNDNTSLRKAASFEKSPTLNTRLEIKVDATASFAQTTRELIKNKVQAMTPLGGTPIVDALYEAAQYYRGGLVTGGASSRRGYRDYLVSDPASFNSSTNRLGYFQKSAIPTSSSTIGTYYSITSTPYKPLCQIPAEGFSFAEKCQLEFVFQPDTPESDFNANLGFNRPSARATYYTPITDSSCQTNHVVLLSDGRPTVGGTTNIENAVTKFIFGNESSYSVCSNPTTPSAACKIYVDEMRKSKDSGMSSITCATDTSTNPNKEPGKCGPEIAQFLATHDNKAGISGSTVKTHTIGMQIDFEPGAEDYLKLIAKSGKGSYYRVDTAEELLLAFQTIIATAMSDSSSFASPAISVNVFNRLYHNNEIYFTFFKPSNTVAWDGNVKRYNLCTAKTGCNSAIVGKGGTAAIGSDGGILSTAQEVWSTLTEPDGAKVLMAGAGGVLPAPDTRKIYSNVVGDTAIALTDAVNAVTTGNSSLTAEMLNVATETNPSTVRNEVINWVRGYTDATAGTLREWRFGDPLHSTPGVFTYGKETDGTPKTKVIVNTNEGAIRMLDGKTGVEDWMFIPRDMLKIQKDLKANAVAPQRIYGIDGRPVVWARDNNYNGVIEGTDSVWVFSGMRRGGRNIYALQVTPDTSNPPAHKPRLAWTIFGGQTSDQGDFSKLGQTWSTPIVTKVLYNGVPKQVLLFAGGFDATTQDTTATYQQQATMGNTIYMVDPLDGGKLLWSAGNTSNSTANLKLTGMNYSFPSDLTVIDGDGDGLSDRIYVGDTGGQLWRVDVRDVGKGYAVGGRLAVLGNSTSDAGKRRFFYPPDVARLTDTKYSPYAQDFDLVLIGSGHRPNPLNKTIQDRLYAFRDRQTGWLIGDSNSGKSGNAVQDSPAFLDQTVAGGSAPASTKFFTITEDKLYDATTEVLNNTTTEITVLDGAKELIKKSLGWKVELAVLDDGGAKSFVGEKALAKPLVLNGIAYYTTFLPPQPKAADAQAATTDACQPTADLGKAKSYAINILTGEGAIPNKKRAEEIGGGIPAEPIAVFTENGVSVYASVGSGNPADPASPPALKIVGPGGQLPRETVYWIEE